MEMDKSPGLPPSSRFLGVSLSSGNASNKKPEFSYDISNMSDNPQPKNLGHRRAHSEIVTLPDDINFGSDLGVVGAADEHSLSDETEEDYLSMCLDMDNLNSSSATLKFQVGESSTPVGSGSGSAAALGVGAAGVNMSIGVGSSERPRVRHQHSQSMDVRFRPDMLISGSEEVAPAADTKKPMSAAKLAELAISDPKRAKRIWANRQSAARSKERKMRYMTDLERKLLTLQTEATSLSAQLSIVQRDNSDLITEHNELKLQLQSVDQQCNLQDALNDALKDEIQHLKIVNLQLMPNGGPMMNYASYGPTQQFFPTNPAVPTLQQFQQLQIHPHQHQPQFPPHQLHQLQQQQTGEMRARGPVPSPNQKDGSSEASSSAPRD